MDAWMFKLLSWIICYCHLQIICQGHDEPCLTRIDTDMVPETFCQLDDFKKSEKLSCLEHEEILITDVFQAIKREDVCSHKVVIESNIEFCCKRKKSDLLLDSICLKYRAFNEEKDRYTKTLLLILSTCSQRRWCILNTTTVELIPRGITSIDNFSAFVGVGYTCYKGKSKTITQANFCEPTAVNGTNVFLRCPETFSTAPENTFNCSCTVTSSSRIIVTALDVRLGYNQTAHGSVQLVFSNQSARSALACEEDSVLFGSRTLFESDETLSIQLNELHRFRLPSMVWLNISSIDGSPVTVLCNDPEFVLVLSKPISTSEPPQPQPPQTALIPRIRSNREIEYGFSYWSFVFAIVGVIGACCTMGIALAIFLTCRRKLRRDEKYDNEPMYATVADYVQHGTPLRMSRSSIYSQKKCRAFSSESYQSECNCYSMTPINKPNPEPPSPPPKTYERYKDMKGDNSDKLAVEITVLPTNVDYITPTSDERLITEYDDCEVEEHAPENIMVTKL